MATITGLPKEGLASYFKKKIEKEALETATEIQALAIAEAPKDTGNYANNISVDSTDKKEILIIAGAIYSYWLEYGLKKDGTKFINQPPYATLRKSAREVAREKGYKYV